MVVFFSTITVITPPAVSIPKDNGVTSKSKTLSKLSPSSLFKTAAYMAAP